MNVIDTEAPFVVVDVGGTTLRIADYDPMTGALSGTRRTPVEGMARDPNAPVPVLQERVVEQLAREIGARIARDGGRCAPRTVGVAFAGPVTADGLVLAAPTVWGGRSEPLPLGALLTARVGAPVVVVNDLTAATWRYAATDAGPSASSRSAPASGTRSSATARSCWTRAATAGSWGTGPTTPPLTPCRATAGAAATWGRSPPAAVCSPPRDGRR